METYNLISFFGIFVLLGFAWFCSADKKNIHWRVIWVGTAIQLLFALFVFVVPAGAKVFLAVNNLVVKILESASVGNRFLFGRLALSPGTVNESGETSLGFFLAFQALPMVVFFASLMGLLYYLGIMPILIRGFAYVFTKLMHVSGAESLCVSSEIFVGIESSLTIRPYLDRMTQSELTTVITAGMATVASNVLAIYIFMLQEYFPTIAGHLISASFLSAPAALVMSKILLPETETPETLGMHVKPRYVKENNFIEAIINGANAGVKLIVGICALLLAFLGLVSLLDLILGAFGTGLNHLLGLKVNWTLKGLLGYLFYPLTLVIGVPPSDASTIAGIIGERAVLTEVTSYQDLARALAQGLIHHPRSIVICTYALCGFAHIASLAIFIGGYAALVPGRIKDLTRIGPRAFLAATLSCLMTAAVAGTFYNHGSVLFGK